ncbi:MAG: 30S ribosomal protein S15 [Clostridia bacterium]|jgi:small subunit ribosomal protein S15|nr:30S ribosomal protein S15 [Clostridia bacterium]MDD4276057.1 30S ribosomal protein S15 [Clostridia bacterium]
MEKAKTQEIVKTYARKEGDTGSPEVQIALLSQRITDLTAHLDVHKKDQHSRRGLLMLVSQRKSLLKYLEKKDINKQRELKKSLGIR